MMTVNYQHIQNGRTDILIRSRVLLRFYNEPDYTRNYHTKYEFVGPIVNKRNAKKDICL